MTFEQKLLKARCAWLNAEKRVKEASIHSYDQPYIGHAARERLGNEAYNAWSRYHSMKTYGPTLGL